MNFKKNKRSEKNVSTSQPAVEVDSSTPNGGQVVFKKGFVSKVGKKAIALLVLIVLAMVGLCYYFFWHNKDSEPPENPTSINNKDSIVTVEDVDVVQETIVEGKLANIQIDDLKFDSYHVSVEAGTTINWSNNGDNACKFKIANYNSGEALDSRNLAVGEEYRYTFDKVGPYTFECSNDQPHKGVVRVYEETGD